MGEQRVIVILFFEPVYMCFFFLLIVCVRKELTVVPKCHRFNIGCRIKKKFCLSLVNRRLSFVEGTMAMHAQSWCPFFSHFFCNRLSYKCVFVSAAQWQRAEFQWTKEQQGIDPSFLFLEFLFRYQCCCSLHGLQMHVIFFVSCVGLTMGIECWRVEYKLTLKMKTATHGLTRVEYMIYGKAFTRSSHVWGSKLLAPALAPKVLLVHSSFGRATCFFSKRCECAFRVFCVWSVHFVGNVLIHHGPFFYCSSGKRSLLLRSKISRDIWQISCEISEIEAPKVLKKLDAASRFESFISFSLESQRNAGKMAHQCTYTSASVFDKRQKFCESAPRLDGLANLRFGDRTTEPERKRCGPTRVRA